jgi:hypothetical protein
MVNSMPSLGATGVFKGRGSPFPAQSATADDHWDLAKIFARRNNETPLGGTTNPERMDVDTSLYLYYPIYHA